MGRSARIDRDHVTLATEVEALYWEAKLGAERQAIGEALAEIGDHPGAVARWLASHHKSHERPGEQRPPG